MFTQNAVRALLSEAGAKLLRNHKHVVYRLPNGARFTMSATPSDWRNSRNNYTELKRLLGISRPERTERREERRRRKKPKEPFRPFSLKTLPQASHVSPSSMASALAVAIPEYAPVNSGVNWGTLYERKPYKPQRHSSAHRHEKVAPVRILTQDQVAMANRMLREGGQNAYDAYIETVMHPVAKHPATGPSPTPTHNLAKCPRCRINPTGGAVCTTCATAVPRPKETPMPNTNAVAGLEALDQFIQKLEHQLEIKRSSIKAHQEAIETDTKHVAGLEESITSFKLNRESMEKIAPLLMEMGIAVPRPDEGFRQQAPRPAKGKRIAAEARLGAVRTCLLQHDGGMTTAELLDALPKPYNQCSSQALYQALHVMCSAGKLCRREARRPDSERALVEFFLPES